jgi:hypothetical protein
VALAKHDAADASCYYIESAELSMTISDTMGVAQALSGLAGVALLAQQPERAARWLAATRGYCDSIGATTIGNDEQYERALAGARRSLNVRQFDAAWAAGRCS